MAKVGGEVALRDGVGWGECRMCRRKGCASHAPPLDPAAVCLAQ